MGLGVADELLAEWGRATSSTWVIPSVSESTGSQNPIMPPMWKRQLRPRSLTSEMGVVALEWLPEFCSQRLAGDQTDRATDEVFDIEVCQMGIETPASTKCDVLPGIVDVPDSSM